MLVDEETKTAYLAAWGEWHQQVEHLHRVFFEGDSIRPDQMKGLLNRETRKKDAYDAARLRLLGLDSTVPVTTNPDENPFRSAH